MNDIAICGKDERFCRMLELELQDLGYTVTRNPRGGHYRLWVVDLDTVSANHTDRLYLGFTYHDPMQDSGHLPLCQAVFQRPFSMSTLRQEVLRLLSPEQIVPQTRRASAMLALTSHGFELDGEPLTLTEAEERVLQALYERRGETVSRAELSAILGNETNDKLGDVYICLLRKKLEANGTPRLLFTVRGVGYRLEKE